MHLLKMKIIMRNRNINDKIPIISSQVRWLLKHGAKVKSDKYGKTPLSDAAENKQLEVEKCIFLYLLC